MSLPKLFRVKGATYSPVTAHGRGVRPAGKVSTARGLVPAHGAGRLVTNPSRCLQSPPRQPSQRASHSPPCIYMLLHVVPFSLKQHASTKATTRRTPAKPQPTAPPISSQQPVFAKRQQSRSLQVGRKARQEDREGQVYYFDSLGFHSSWLGTTSRPLAPPPPKGNAKADTRRRLTLDVQVRSG